MIRVTENKELLEELYELLKEESVATPSEKAILAHKINGLQERITANVRARLSEMRSDVITADSLVTEEHGEKVSYNKLYEELKAHYREAMSIASECSILKKLMRERKEEKKQ